MARNSGLWDSLSKVGKDLGKEMIKLAKKNKTKIIVSTASTALSVASKSGISFLSKPYFVSFKNLKPNDIEIFKLEMGKLGFKIQLSLTSDETYSGKILNYFRTSKNAEIFTYDLPIGIAEYYVTKLE